MHRVHLLDVAINDIVERIDYLRARWSDNIADQAYIDLMNKLDLLATQARLGNVPPELSRLGIANFYVLVHERHMKILYEVDDEAGTIYIHMVFGSNQDFQTLLYKRIMRM